MTTIPTITTREILSGFRLPNVMVREYVLPEPVPHFNSDTVEGSGLYVDTDVSVTQYQFEHGGMVVKRTPNGEVFSLKVQVIDQYSYQREFSVEYRRVPGTSSFRWVASTYQHPFHRVDQDQDVTAGKARRFIERLIELVENHPSLVFNNSGETSHAPPRHRARHEGFVRWHTALLNGAEFSVKLLDQ